MTPPSRRAMLHRLLDSDSTAAGALTLATLVALVWANVGESYATFWSTEAGVRVGSFELSMTLQRWVSEGLMTFFFFSVGLDVRREFALGELRDRTRAVLPVCAAVGGMVVPAAVFLLINGGGPAAGAWGVVISSDTAFALGMLALVGPAHAPRLRVFLLTLAVVDDIGALTVIAVFYTQDLAPAYLLLAAAGLAAVWVLQRTDRWQVAPYLLVGAVTWWAVYRSGVHATLAGVLIALLMPVHPTRLDDVDVASRVVHLFRQAPRARTARLARRSIDRSVPLNQRLTEKMARSVNYLVVPVFALANAGVSLSGGTLAAALTSPLTWGVVVALVGGKFVGVTGGATLVRRLVPAARVPGLDGPRIAGVGALSGIGFTISLLVVNLALDDPALQDQARVGVLLAALLALLAAWAIFAVGSRRRALPEPAGQRLPREVDPARDHIRGPVDAPATLVVYAALDHAYRTRTAEVEREVLDRGAGRVRLVLRHHTTTDEDLVRALGLEAAGRQGAFWEMHDAVVGLREDATAEDLCMLAARQDLDVTAFRRDLRTSAHLGRVEDDNLDASAAELPRTAVFYVNGHRLEGPPDSFYISRALAGTAAAAEAVPPPEVPPPG